MAAHIANISWQRGKQEFADGKYSRAHLISFDGGVSIAGSSSPSVVKLPLSKEDAADPEELLIAALSSCHMLTFLDLARRAGFVIDSYDDTAEGKMGKNAKGAIAVTRVVLKPKIVWAGERTPSAEELHDLHHRSHELCFIANSFAGEVVVEE
ncbi:MAG: OsmC family protein [Caulobacterales bacterium]|jgi:organic hydroperoxide reductase OsmC/OhrA|nr:OsmC family protein [Caulobacterales bacterium]